MLIRRLILLLFVFFVVPALGGCAADYSGGSAYRTYHNLHDAAAYGDWEATKRLLAEGGNVHIKNSHGSTPLHMAGFTNNGRIMAALIEAGGDINTRNNYGMTPLHVAAEYGHINTARVLLDAGAEVNPENDAGKTPMDLSRRLGSSEMESLLREHGGACKYDNC